MCHPDVPERLRGTYAGLASAPVIDYLTRLGVTSIELMPVHAFIDDRQLVERGLRNYWGYNTIGFFALEPRYLAHSSIREFKTMVKTLHSAGLEVILDVVYNHTAEGNHLGPTLSLKGIDNSVYYRLMPDNPRYYRDYTGTGNTLNMRHPRCCNSLWIACGIGCWICTSMASASILLRLWPASFTKSIVWERFSTSSIRTRAFPSETDCRAVGPGRGWISGRKFSRGLGGVERSLPQYCPLVLEGRCRDGRRPGVPPHRIQRSLRPQRTPSLCQRKFCNRS